MASLTDRLGAHSDVDGSAHAMPEHLIGKIAAGTYRLRRWIGSGASGDVFEAEHVRLKKPFALKLLRPDGASRRSARRFKREPLAIARVTHENVVFVVDCGTLDDHTPFFVMELLEGEDLRGILDRERTLPARRAVRIVIEACRGISCAHAAGLIHRDLKPENLFIARRASGEDWCKILDFGIAKMESSLSTADGAIIGTVRYMAPEQLEGSAPVGPAADIYSLGAILYECLAGRGIHEAPTVRELMYRVMNSEPEPLAHLRPDIPVALTDVVMRTVSKTPGARPRSASEFETLLSLALASHGSSAATLSDDEPARNLPFQNSRAAMRRSSTLPSMLLAGGVGAGLAWMVSVSRVGPSDQGAPTVASLATVAGGASPAGNTTRAPALASASEVAASASSAADEPLEQPGSRQGSTERPAPANPQSRSAAPSPSPPILGALRDSLSDFDEENPYAD